MGGRRGVTGRTTPARGGRGRGQRHRPRTGRVVRAVVAPGSSPIVPDDGVGIEGSPRPWVPPLRLEPARHHSDSGRGTQADELRRRAPAGGRGRTGHPVPGLGAAELSGPRAPLTGLDAPRAGYGRVCAWCRPARNANRNSPHGPVTRARGARIRRPDPPSPPAPAGAP